MRIFITGGDGFIGQHMVPELSTRHEICLLDADLRDHEKVSKQLKDFDPETTAAVFMVGEKDAQRLGGKFFRPWEGVANVGYRDGAYTLIAPHVSLKVPGFGEMSGTTLRQVLATADAETFKDVMGFFEPKIYNMLQTKFSQIKSEVIESFLLEGSLTGLADTSADDGPRYMLSLIHI